MFLITKVVNFPNITFCNANLFAAGKLMYCTRAALYNHLFIYDEDDLLGKIIYRTPAVPEEVYVEISNALILFYAKTDGVM